MELIKISQLEEQSEAKPNQYTIITDDDNVSKKIDIGTILLNSLPFWKIPQISQYDNVKNWYKIGKLTSGMVSFNLRAGTLGPGLVFDKNCILGVEYNQGYNLEQSHELEQANFRIGNDGELYVNLPQIALQYDLYLTSISKRTTFTPITPVVNYSLEEIEANTREATIELSLKQDKTDENLATTDKTIVGGINEVKTQVDGKIDGPASATDNTLPRFDGTTGKLLKSGGSITNLDNGNVGIANNNPTDKLHVIGNIRSSAEVHAGTKVVIASKVEQVYDAVNQSLKFNFL